MKRRNFLTAAGLAAGASTLTSALPRPAIAQDRLEWKMVTAWPKGLPGLGGPGGLLPGLGGGGLPKAPGGGRQGFPGFPFKKK